MVFDLETYNDQEIVDAHAVSLHEVNRLRDRWYRDITREEIPTDRNYAILYNKSCRDSVLNMLKYISEKHGGDERTHIDKEGDEVVTSFRILLLAHISSGIDC